MTVIQALVLGVVQGVTEFLPVSSSGHLIVIPTLFNWKVQSLFFDVAVHVGTLLAVLIFFRARIIMLLRRVLEGDSKLLLTVVLATLPAVLLGVLFDDLVETVLRSPVVVVFNLLFWGVVLWVADVYRERARASVELDHVGYGRGLIIGVAQALALIPGTSRSGITISAGLFAGLTRRSSLEFSFLLSIPVIAGSALLKGAAYLKDPAVYIGAVPLALGIIASFLSGWCALRLLWRLAATYRFWPFALYRLLLGAGLLIWLMPL